MSKKRSWWRLQIEEVKKEEKHYKETKKILKDFVGCLKPTDEQIIKKLQREQEWIRKSLHRT